MISKQIYVLVREQEELWWPSLQEVLPAIVKSWIATTEFAEHQVHLIPSKKLNASVLFEIASKADIVVGTMLSPRISRAIQLLRGSLGYKNSIVIHCFSEGALGGRGLYELSGVLTENDVLLCASRSEAQCLNLCFPLAKIRVVPFPLFPCTPRLPQVIVQPKKRIDRVVYIGRISEQKNLHTLFLALAIINEKTPHLLKTVDIYGKEDCLGSPNMALRSCGYSRMLRNLSKQLGLKQVRWKGHVSMAGLEREVYKRPHVLATASLHSDENFGVAVFRSLCSGGRVVATNWGGHRDFSETFKSSQLSTVSVQSGPSGPFVSPFDLALAIQNALLIPSIQLPSKYRLGKYTVFGSAKELVKICNDLFHGSAPPLSPSPLAELIGRRRALGQKRKKRITRWAGANPFLSESMVGSIFNGYDDSLAHRFFHAYGMKKSHVPANSSDVMIVPWIRFTQRSILVTDPHRGHFEFKQGRKTLSRKSFCGAAFRLDPKGLKWLLKNGFAFSMSS